MANRIGLRLNVTRRIALATAAIAAFGVPVLVGAMNAPSTSVERQPGTVISQSQAGAPSAAAVEFDVASIRQNTSGDRPLNIVDLTFLTAVASGSRNGRFRMQGIGAIPLHLLIQLAYNVKDFQIRGGPSWVSADRYDIEAKADGNATFDQMRPMLQSLLADRFKLTLRRETRELPVYELVAANGGLKIAAMKEGECVTLRPGVPRPPLPRTSAEIAPLNICGGVRRQIVSPAPDRRDRIEAVGISMPKLIEFLSDEVGRVVLDRTGFMELFNVRLEFASSVAPGDGPGPLRDPGTPALSNASGPSIFAAVQEQLGMQLNSTEGPVEVFVIDHVERPSAN